mmetsp:Transcript_43617/g.115213  ORF Transcript_43617/g.115213 Transcript_43617/m.115213 type:complete len:253 (+) Transcript_43617:741-1499(+)
MVPQHAEVQASLARGAHLAVTCPEVVAVVGRRAQRLHGMALWTALGTSLPPRNPTLLPQLLDERLKLQGGLTIVEDQLRELQEFLRCLDMATPVEDEPLQPDKHVLGTVDGSNHRQTFAVERRCGRMKQQLASPGRTSKEVRPERDEERTHRKEEPRPQAHHPKSQQRDQREPTASPTDHVQHDAGHLSAQLVHDNVRRLHDLILETLEIFQVQPPMLGVFRLLEVWSRKTTRIPLIGEAQMSQTLRQENRL